MTGASRRDGRKMAFASNDDGDVMVFIRYAVTVTATATVTATGKHVAMNMHDYWKFRDGNMCYVRSSEDTVQVTAALTPLARARSSPAGPDPGLLRGSHLHYRGHEVESPEMGHSCGT